MEILVKNALLSVYDKSGLKELATFLSKNGVKIYCTEGTSKVLNQMGIQSVLVESITDMPELFGGRVKTLHPKIFGGILAQIEKEEDRRDLKTHSIPTFDLVVVNFYPFSERTDTVDLIDIGGPAMVRASAKNHNRVTIVSSSTDYEELMSELSKHDMKSTVQFRKKMALLAFKRTCLYDATIVHAWNEDKFPPLLTFTPQLPLRYGENPHQKAVWCSEQKPKWKLLSGKELSYNNLLDTDAALALIGEFDEPAVAIIKHNNPCGVASGKNDFVQLFQLAKASDPVSAFGGVVSINQSVDESLAVHLSQTFFEVVVAKSFSEEAKKILSDKKNLRLIEWDFPHRLPIETRPALGGWLMQTTDTLGSSLASYHVVSGTIDPSLWGDLNFAWLVVKHVKSNAIVIALNQKTIGIGAGQMSRVEAVEIALRKASTHGTKGAVLASDAFFPFKDNIELLKDTGIRAIIQPGGSIRDEEVIEACKALNIAMVFTGERHFKH